MLREQLKKLHEAAGLENTRVILALLEPDKSAKVLDVGCGDGSFTLKIGEKVGTPELYGIEIQEQWVRLCEARGIKVYHADLNEPLPLDDESFDVVCANQVLEHLCRTDLFIRECRRVLKRGGYAIISTPNLAVWHNITCIFLGWQLFTTAISDEIIVGNPLQDKYKRETWRGSYPLHRRVPTYRGLKEVLEYHEFKVEIMIGVGYFPFPTKAAKFLSRIDPKHCQLLTVKARKI